MKKTNKTRYAILGMLFDKARSGYDIKKFMEDSTGHFWQETDASIYPMLKKLEAEGTVKSKATLRGKRERTVYRISPAGKAEFTRWMAKEVEPSPYRKELLLKLFFGAFVPRNTIIKHLEAQQKKIGQMLKQYDYIAAYVLSEVPDDNPNKLFWHMALRNGILLAQAEATWLDECINRLKQPK
jgi:DNA-binding PadR family transcriptional regulator